MVLRRQTGADGLRRKGESTAAQTGVGRWLSEGGRGEDDSRPAAAARVDRDLKLLASGRVSAGCRNLTRSRG